MKAGVRLGGVFTVECRDRNGKLKWSEDAPNLVVNEGINHILDILFASETQVATWYVALLTSSPSLSATDGASDLSEFTDYTGDRKEYVDVRTGQTVSNSASKAEFAITGSGTVGGAALVAAATGDDILLSGGPFTAGDRSVSSGDTASVTYTFSGADDGS